MSKTVDTNLVHNCGVIVTEFYPPRLINIRVTNIQQHPHDLFVALPDSQG